MARPPEPTAPIAGAFQPDTLATRPLGWAGVALLGTVVAVVAIVLAWLHALGMRPGGDRFDAREAVEVRGPTLQSAPQRDLAAWRAQQAARLEARGWVDAASGVARVPVDEAAALVLARAASEAHAAQAASASGAPSAAAASATSASGAGR